LSTTQWYLQAGDKGNTHNEDILGLTINVLIYSLTYGMPQWRINGKKKKKTVVKNFDFGQ